jgi:hypothetical protein
VDRTSRRVLIRIGYQQSSEGTSVQVMTVPSDLSAGGVFIGASNACWDGRNDQIGAYDNVVLEVVIP